MKCIRFSIIHILYLLPLKYYCISLCLGWRLSFSLNGLLLCNAEIELIELYLSLVHSKYTDVLRPSITQHVASENGDLKAAEVRGG